MRKFRFRKFQVYRDALSFRKDIKLLVNKYFPKTELYQLSDQIVRAVNSIILHIAEGADRSTDRDFANFLNRAHTSLNEVVSCLDMALMDKYINEKIYEEYLKKSENLANQLTAFRSKLLSDDKQIADKQPQNSHRSKVTGQRSQVKGHRSTRGGFTLIELLVAAAIIVLFTGGAIAAIRSYHERQILVQEAKNFKERLRAIQVAAQTGTQPTNGCASTYGSTYGPYVGMKSIRVDFNSDTSFTEKTVCTNDLEIDRRTYYLSDPDVRYSSTQTSIEFKTLSQGVSVPATICLSRGDRNYKLQVTTAGEIDDLGLVSSCP